MEHLGVVGGADTIQAARAAPPDIQKYSSCALLKASPCPLFISAEHVTGDGLD